MTATAAVIVKMKLGTIQMVSVQKYCELTRAVRHDMTEWLYANCLVPPAC